LVREEGPLLLLHELEEDVFQLLRRLLNFPPAGDPREGAGEPGEDVERASDIRLLEAPARAEVIGSKPDPPSVP
jgi:hypothetical protein